MRKTRIKKRTLSQKYSQKFRFLLGGIIGIIGLSYLSFNDYGIVHHFQIKKQLEQINSQIDTLEIQQVQIKETIRKLQSDYDYIEKMARENMKLVKEGEELYIFRKNDSDLKDEKK